MQRDGWLHWASRPRFYVDHGLTGCNRDRPGLRAAFAACRAGDTLVVTKLDRLARSLPDACDIEEKHAAADVKLNMGGSVHNPNDPIGRLRTRQGWKVAKATGRLRGRAPRLKSA